MSASRKAQARIGEHRGNQCEVCKAPHMGMISRGYYRSREAYMVLETCEVFCAETGLPMGRMRCTSEFNAQTVLRIVLTKDGLCQRHHLRLESKHRQRNASRARRNRGGQLDMEDFL